MSIYEVELTETINYPPVRVEASSREQAEAEVESLWMKGEAPEGDCELRLDAKEAGDG